MNVIDCFSKFAWAYPLKTKETKPICEILCKLFYKEGIPLIMQSDNGGEFVSNIIKDVMPKIGIKLINGHLIHQLLKDKLRNSIKLSSLFKKKIQIELSIGNNSRVENWSEELVPEIMSTYIHRKHRSLSRTPWEVYYSRSAPHSRYSTPQLESFRPVDVELSSHPDDEVFASGNDNHLMDDIRAHAELHEKIVIQTLNQTRKIQVENHRKISKGNKSSQKLS